MSGGTGIQWTDETWNPIAGCSPVSEGCRNCYAAKEAIRLAGHPNAKVRDKYEGTAEMRGVGRSRRAVFTGRVNVAPDETITQPLRWTRPRRVFVNSMSDLFHPEVPFKFIAAIFGVMMYAPQHTFQILTKRPERAVAWFTWMGHLIGDEDGQKVLGPRTDPVLGCEMAAARYVADLEPMQRRSPWPLPNVWIGTSVEDQAAADERIPHLLQVPAALRFLSCEPLLGPVDLVEAGGIKLHMPVPAWSGDGVAHEPAVDWVIVGGESGPKARPFDLEWGRSLVRQCKAAAVPVFVKQVGARPRYTPAGEYRAMRIPLKLQDRKGGDPEEWPEDLRVQEMPEVLA